MTSGSGWHEHLQLKKTGMDSNYWKSTQWNGYEWSTTLIQDSVNELNICTSNHHLSSTPLMRRVNWCWQQYKSNFYKMITGNFRDSCSQLAVKQIK